MRKGEESFRNRGEGEPALVLGTCPLEVRVMLLHPSFGILGPLKQGFEILADLASGEIEEERNHILRYLALVRIKSLTKFKAFSWA